MKFSMMVKQFTLNILTQVKSEFWSWRENTFHFTYWTENVFNIGMHLDIFELILFNLCVKRDTSNFKIWWEALILIEGHRGGRKQIF